MKKFALLLSSATLLLASTLFAAEPLCLTSIQSSGINDDTRDGIVGLFKVYIENQSKYQFSNGENCEKNVSLNISKIGQNTVLFAKLQNAENTLLWSGQQKANSEETIDEALLTLANQFGRTPTKSVYTSTQPPQNIAAPAPQKQQVKQVESKPVPAPVVQRPPRDIRVYMGLGLGLTKFIGDEINEFTDHEPLSLYDFFLAYDAKNLITIINLDFSYKTNSIKTDSDYSYRSYNEIETSYFGVGISFYYPFLEGPFTPYLGLGMSATNYSISYEWSSSDHDIDDNGLQAHAGAGFILNRGKRISMWVHGEYFFNTYEPIDHTFHGFDLSMKVALGF